MKEKQKNTTGLSSPCAIYYANRENTIASFMRNDVISSKKIHYGNAAITASGIVLFLLMLLLSSASAQQCTDNDRDGFFKEGGLCGATDCDDNDRSVHPGALKLCDGKDSNCDGKRDFPTDVDNDLDGVPWCAGDCNDNHPDISPLVQEGPYASITCSDGIDNDCDNTIDLNDTECEQPCVDKDGDGFGYPGRITCDNGPRPDCNDNDTSIHPDADDNSCNNIDENCDGYYDEGYIKSVTACGVGTCSTTGSLICSDGIELDTCTPGIALAEGPHGDLTCNDNIDNDCDGMTDSIDTDCIEPCQDNDNDGYGSPGNSICSNGPVSDCNDNDASIRPNAEDNNCNNIDENCDGYYDEGYVISVTTCGQGICSSSGLLVCSDGVEIDTCSPGAALSEGPAGNPTCSDNIDNDCDGITDSNDTNCLEPCIDNDGDGYGSPGNITCPSGPVADCNDQDPAINAHDMTYCDPAVSNCDSITLSWTSPIQNMDGSELTDLAGYKIYFGEYSNIYTDVIDIGNSTCFKAYIQSQSQSCFSITAYDTLGNESEYSNEACYLTN
jgi:hypothetical protein